MASAACNKPSTTSANDGKTSTEPEWQTVASKRPKPQVKPRKPAVMKRRPAACAHKEDVVGNERKLPIKAAMRFANVFASRLDPNESESTIKNYLESTLKLDVKVELC